MPRLQITSAYAGGGEIADARTLPCSKEAFPAAIFPTPVFRTKAATWVLDSLRGSSDKIGTIQRRLAWPLRKDDTHKSRSVPRDRPLLRLLVPGLVRLPQGPRSQHDVSVPGFEL